MANHWNEFKKGETLQDLIDPILTSIIETLGSIVGRFYQEFPSRPMQTRLIKDTLALLGHEKFSYKVYANNLSPALTQLEGGTFKNSEWLFDLHWYTEGSTPYTTTQLPLVMECEWQQNRKGDPIVPFSGIKYDFQKLLVTNAKNRLMIFKVKKLDDLDKLDEYFEDNISNYVHLSSESSFLFVAFFDKQQTFYYRQIKKR